MFKGDSRASGGRTSRSGCGSATGCRSRSWPGLAWLDLTRVDPGGPGRTHAADGAMDPGRWSPTGCGWIGRWCRQSRRTARDENPRIQGPSPALVGDRLPGREAGIVRTAAGAVARSCMGDDAHHPRAAQAPRLSTPAGQIPGSLPTGVPGLARFLGARGEQPIGAAFGEAFGQRPIAKEGCAPFPSRPPRRLSLGGGASAGRPVFSSALCRQLCPGDRYGLRTREPGARGQDRAASCLVRKVWLWPPSGLVACRRCDGDLPEPRP